MGLFPLWYHFLIIEGWVSGTLPLLSNYVFSGEFPLIVTFLLCRSLLQDYPEQFIGLSYLCRIKRRRASDMR